MLLRLNVVLTQNHRRHGKAICKDLFNGKYGRYEIQIALLIQTTEDVSDFSKRPGYPVSGKSNVN